MGHEQRRQVVTRLAEEWLQLSAATQRVRRIRRVGSHLMPVSAVCGVVLLALGGDASPITIGLFSVGVSLAGVAMANLPLPTPRKRLSTPDCCPQEDTAHE